MGIVAGIHLVDDAYIDQFLENPSASERDFYDHYVNPFGEFHHEGDNFFYLNKAWGIASFLIKENDSSKEKILNSLLGEPFENVDGLNYIKAGNTAKMNELIQQISSKQIEEAYNEPKMLDPYVYNVGFITKENNWDTIIEHVNTIFAAFKKATEDGKGLIIYFG